MSPLRLYVFQYCALMPSTVVMLYEGVSPSSYDPMLKSWWYSMWWETYPGAPWSAPVVVSSGLSKYYPARCVSYSEGVRKPEVFLHSASLPFASIASHHAPASETYAP